MTWTNLPAARANRHLYRRAMGWLVIGYPLLYAVGYLSKSVNGSAAIWPSHALAFAAFMLLPWRLWPIIMLGMISWEMLARPVLYWVTVQSIPTLTLTCSFALANILTSAGPASLARMMRLFRRQDRFA